MEKEKVFGMSPQKVYPLLVAKAERKGRSADEVDEVACRLTGYTKVQLKKQLEKAVTYREFFSGAPAMNVNADKIAGTVCGIKAQDFEDPLMQKILRK